MTPDICSNMGDEANKGIHLVVIGAGLAGLAAAVSTKLANPAHQVTVLEATKELQELGVSDSPGYQVAHSNSFSRQAYKSPLMGQDSSKHGVSR